MTNSKNAYQRRSIRLQGYDYTQPGFYFVTICTHNKKWMFGEIVNDEMHLNNIGRIVQSVWSSLPERFPHVQLDEYVIMPNHIHGIIICKETGTSTPKVVDTSRVPKRFRQFMDNAWSTRLPHPQGRDKSGPYVSDAERPHNEPSIPVLGEIIRTFKAASTHRIRSSGRRDFAWQHNYHDHIIRNDKALDLIHQYIIDNPAKWAEDSLNTLNTKEGSLV